MRGINLHDDWGWSNVPRLFGLSTGALIGIGSAVGGASSGIGSIVGSGKSSSASKSAANESLIATQESIANEDNLYNRAMGYAQPYIYAGQNALPQMANIAQAEPAGARYLGNAQQYYQQAAGMTPPSVVTENWLQQTPGYQWQLQQGLQSTQAAAAARGLGVSGASLKGAATYATGLADANYQNQFSNAQTAWQDVMNLGNAQQSQASLANAMQNQQYGYWSSLASLGENASAMAGNQSTTTAGNISNALSTGSQQYGNYLTQAGQAQAAGTSGVSNSINQGINNYLSYKTLQEALQGSGSTSGWNDSVPITG